MLLDMLENLEVLEEEDRTPQVLVDLEQQDKGTLVALQILVQTLEVEEEELVLEVQVVDLHQVMVVLD
jgi:hypothetical protein